MILLQVLSHQELFYFLYVAFLWGHTSEPPPLGPKFFAAGAPVGTSRSYHFGNAGSVPCWFPKRGRYCWEIFDTLLLTSERTKMTNEGVIQRKCHPKWFWRVHMSSPLLDHSALRKKNLVPGIWVCSQETLRNCWGGGVCVDGVGCNSPFVFIQFLVWFVFKVASFPLSLYMRAKPAIYWTIWEWQSECVCTDPVRKVPINVAANSHVCGRPLLRMLLSQSVKTECYKSSSDRQNCATVIAELLARVIAAIQSTSVRWRSYVSVKKHRK